jgi:hypothetical protein
MGRSIPYLYLIYHDKRSYKYPGLTEASFYTPYRDGRAVRAGKGPKPGSSSPTGSGTRGPRSCMARVPGDRGRQCQILEPVAPLPRPMYMDKRFFAALVALLVGGVVACGNMTSPGNDPGSGSGGSASPAHTSGSSPVRPQGGASSQPPGQPASLTAADNGVTVRLTTGQSITVTLVPAPPFSWHLPAATGSILHRTDASGGYPARRPARATFRAVRPGRAVLSAIDDAQCLHAQHACMLSQRSWHVVIIVTQP